VNEREEIGLVDSFQGEWIKVLVPVMRDVGPAAQSLGGLLSMTSRETFSCVEAIAGNARVPVGTVRKHLVILHKRGWIHNAGRQPTKHGHPRRTATIKITDKTRRVLDSGNEASEGRLRYGILPWWACCHISKIGRLPWAARAVLAIIMARLAGVAKAVQEVSQADLGPDDLAGSIDNLAGDKRFRFSLRSLTEHTGLTRESVVRAKRFLNHRAGIVCWSGPAAGEGSAIADCLEPNWRFRVLVRPASEGRCYLAFGRGSENGQ
jgi:hypothetical protein